MKKVVVVVGPTGSGKTRLSIELAQRFGLEIINGDSVQVYDELSIGSAKIKTEEMAGIPHHLLGHVSVAKPYSVYHFQQEARAAIARIERPAIVGGTGLYIKAALFDYTFQDGGRDPEFERRHAHLEDDKLYRMLRDKNPHTTVDRHNRRRVLRALERATQDDMSFDRGKDDPLYDVLTIYLDLDRTTLEKHLRRRLDRQLEDGFLDEVRKLREQEIRIHAIGYRELNRHLDGFYTLEEAKEDIIKASKRLAKKQKTWFKHQMKTETFDALSPTLVSDVSVRLKSFYESEENM
jgi:tRNA dimethylallyltransferase